MVVEVSQHAGGGGGAGGSGCGCSSGSSNGGAHPGHSFHKSVALPNGPGGVKDDGCGGVEHGGHLAGGGGLDGGGVEHSGVAGEGVCGGGCGLQEHVVQDGCGV